jgi:hypothetical protein
MVGSTSKVTKATKQLVGVKRYVAKNIDNRINIMHEACEIVVEFGVIVGRIQTLKDYLQEDLRNDKNVVSTFVERISIMDDIVKQKLNLPSKSRLKQIQVGWLARIYAL